MPIMTSATEPITSSYTDGTLFITMTGEVDHHTARAIRERIDHRLYLYHPRECVISLGGVNFMDSSGLGLILGRLEVCRHFSCVLRLVDVDARIRRIFTLAGMERITGLEIEGLSKKERVHI